MPIAAGIVGGLGLVGSIGSSLIGSNAADKASQQQAAMQQKVLDMLAPIIAQGKDIAGTALGPLKALLTPGSNMTDTLSQLPGFKFAQDWGQKAVANLGTTTGLSGNTLTAGANFATGLAQQGYGTIVDQLQQLLKTGVGTETTAAGGASTAFTNMGNAQAAGTLGSANALSTGITGGTNAVSNALLTNALFSKFGSGGGGSAGIYSTQTAPGMGFGYPTV